MARNPFPGMNPWFEQRWQDAHTRMLVYFADALQERLPPGLTAVTEEGVRVGHGEDARWCRPDVHIQEDDQTLHDGPATTVEALPTMAGAPSDPVLLDDEDWRERWIEIRSNEGGGHLVTAIELRSPSNKLSPEARAAHWERRRRFLGDGASVVEIDLVRAGAWLVPGAVFEELVRRRATYCVCVWRANPKWRHEFYPIGLQDRLPTVRIPLRPGEPDVPLELQAAVDLCYERGRFDRIDYRREPGSPWGPEEAEWAADCLRAAGLAGSRR